ncbi:hypothetical protein CONLIGDRAFT_685538 [Coniochaeta ligniaria NRRL 30616]|uniref:Very-long-chain 3-oxoacyl-CoA synthase n=1 Tax=Coniochaeta ligniaria NRRL 30616 TaxID=1408157 RepID=A0A1J7IAU1_9PEZI|nr:hypothetical protein CONLIGDRAFT_685538 [Coniochaeta ligniaria NRRL 30616]
MQVERTAIPYSPVATTLVHTLVFVLLWTILQHYATSHGPFPVARRISKLHNILYSILNIPRLGLILLSSPHNDFLARRIYHLIRIYEYLDILTVCASGSPIALHFAVHHLTTPWLTLCRVLYNSDGWRIGAALNVLHHVIMYAYFGGLTSVRRMLPVTGMVQLVIGLIVEAIIVRESIQDERGLFVRELRQGKDAEKVNGS